MSDANNKAVETNVENPYEPPRSEITFIPALPPVPDSILKNIRNAWIAGLISASITLIFVLLAISGKVYLGFSEWEFFDVALLLGLAFGIYKKNRVCAVLMCLYFIAAKIVIFYETGHVSGILMGSLFIYFYVQGARATFAYHKHLSSDN